MPSYLITFHCAFLSHERKVKCSEQWSVCRWVGLCLWAWAGTHSCAFLQTQALRKNTQLFVHTHRESFGAEGRQRIMHDAYFCIKRFKILILQECRILYLHEIHLPLLPLSPPGFNPWFLVLLISFLLQLLGLLALTIFSPLLWYSLSHKCRGRNISVLLLFCFLCPVSVDYRDLTCCLMWSVTMSTS